MRVLFIVEEIPWPLDRGDRIRAYHLLKRLGNNHDVTLVCFNREKEFTDKEKVIRSVTNKVVYIPLSKRQMYINVLLHPFLPVTTGARASFSMKNKINELVAQYKYDLVYVYQLKMAWHTGVLINTPVIIDYTDALSLYKKRMSYYCKGITRWWHNFESARLLNYERIALGKCRLGLFASSEDMNYMRQYSSKNNIRLLPNGVDTDYFKQSHLVNGKNLLYFGNLAYPPNVDGLKYFLTSLFPAIKSAVPGCKLYIAGKNIPAWAKSVGGVVAVGYVEDIREYLRKCAVIVCPLRYGAGTRIKILEAMAAGKPVVSTTLGCEGIRVNAGLDIEVADEPAEFSYKVINLLENAAARESMGRQAAKLVESLYSWTVVADQLNNLLEEIVR